MSISDVFHPVYFDSILNGTKANLKNEFIKSDQTIQTNLKSNISHRSTSQSSNHSNSNSISTQSESSRNKKNKNKSPKKRVRSKPSHSVNCNNSNDLEHVIFLDWYVMPYILCIIVYLVIYDLISYTHNTYN